MASSHCPLAPPFLILHSSFLLWSILTSNKFGFPVPIPPSFVFRFACLCVIPSSSRHCFFWCEKTMSGFSGSLMCPSGVRNRLVLSEYQHRMVLSITVGVVLSVAAAFRYRCLMSICSTTGSSFLIGFCLRSRFGVFLLYLIRKLLCSWLRFYSIMATDVLIVIDPVCSTYTLQLTSCARFASLSFFSSDVLSDSLLMAFDGFVLTLVQVLESFWCFLEVFGRQLIPGFLLGVAVGVAAVVCEPRGSGCSVVGGGGIPGVWCQRVLCL